MSNLNISIRQAQLSDLTEIQEMFVNTIKAVCKNDYSPEQIKAWTSSIENKARWINKLTAQYFLVAVLNNTIVGFASLENNDYVDFLYVHKDYQKQGIARKLYTAIEKEAVQRKATAISSDVSLTAKSFFEQNGFKTIVQQQHTIYDTVITNYKMVKTIATN